MIELERRLTDLEVYVANQEQTIEDLNAEVLRQSKALDVLARQLTALKDSVSDSLVKPLSEEVPPPHY